MTQRGSMKARLNKSSALIDYKEINRRIWVSDILSCDIKKVKKWLEYYANHPDLDINQILPEGSSQIPLIVWLAKNASPKDNSEALFKLLIEKIPLEKLQAPISPRANLVHFSCTGESKHNLMHCLAYNKTVSKEIVEALFARGINFYVKGELETQPIHYAAKIGNLHILRIFYDLGIDLNSLVNNVTPLYVAGMRYHTLTLLIEGTLEEELAELKAVINFLEDKTGLKFDQSDMLVMLARENKLELMKEIIKKIKIKVPDIVNIKLLTGSYLLICAIQTRFENLEVIKYLLKEGAKIDLISEEGNNAIDIAIRLKHYNILTELLSVENSANAIKAIMFFNILALPDMGDSKPVLMFAALLKKLKELKDLNLQTDMLNRIDEDKDTILHKSIRHPNINFLKFLLKESKLIDINKNGPEGTPLQLAVKLNKVNVLQALLKCKQIEIDQSTLLGIIIANNAFEALTLLVSEGKINDDNLSSYFIQLIAVLPYQKNPNKETALTDTLKLLLEKIALFNLEKIIFKSLNRAIMCNSNAIANALIKKISGSFSSILSKDEWLKLNDLAIQKGMFSIAKSIQAFYPADKSDEPSASHGLASLPFDKISDQEKTAKEEKSLQEQKQKAMEEFDRCCERLTNAYKSFQKNIADVSMESQKEIAAEYQQYIDNAKEPLKKQIEKINILIARIKNLQRTQDERGRKVRTKGIKLDNDVPIVLEGDTEQKIEKKPSAEYIKTKKAPLRLFESKKQKKKIEHKSRVDNISLLQKKDKKANNVKYALSMWDSLIKALDPVPMDDVELLKLALRNKKLAYPEYQVLQFALESILIELALNAPLGVGLHETTQMRNAVLYHIFNQHHQLTKSDHISDNANDQLIESVAKLLVSIHEYQGLICHEKCHLIEQAPLTKSELLTQVRKSYVDPRNIPISGIVSVSDIEKQNHHDCYRRLSDILDSRIIDSSQLNPEVLKFIKISLWLRSVLAAVKSGNKDKIDAQSKELTRQWRHSEITRQELNELVRDTNVDFIAGAEKRAGCYQIIVS